MFNHTKDVQDATVDALRGIATEALAEVSEDGTAKAEFLNSMIDMYVGGIIDVSFSDEGEPIIALTELGTEYAEKLALEYPVAQTELN